MRKKKRRKKKISLFIMTNILLPLAIGAAIYYFTSPEVLFVKKLDSVLGSGIHIRSIPEGNFCITLIRNYLPDMMWGYALIFALFGATGGQTADLRKLFLTVLLFSLVMEILQLAPAFHGTFDIWDIVAEVLAELAGVLVLKKVLR